MSTQVVDLVCVGSGVSGSAAALAGAEFGLSTVLVEKSARLGGSTTYSYGGLWMGENHHQAEAGIQDSLDEARQYLEFLAGGAALSYLIDTYIQQAPRVLQAFERMGPRFRIIPKVPDHYYPSAPGSKPEGRTLEPQPINRSELGPWANALEQGPYVPPGVSWSDAVAWGGFGNMRKWPADVLAERAGNGMLGAGQALVAQFLAALVKRNVPIMNEFAVQELLVSDGHVSGIRGIHRGEETTIEARRGVVLATGGYEGNPELVRHLEGMPDFTSMFPGSVVGDGLKMATAIGAAIYRSFTNLSLFLGYMVPSAESGGSPTFRLAGINELSYPHTVTVNRAGRRFADESSFQKIVPELRHFDTPTHTYPNLPCFLILDQQFLQKYSFAGRPPGSPAPDWLPRGETLSGLAQQLGINGGALEETVARFNKHAAEGADPEFGRGTSPWSNRSAGDMTHAPNPNLGTLSQPPFHGVRLYPSGVASAGLLTNQYGGVVYVSGQPVSGLYACGNTAGPMDYGVGYQAGLTLTRGITYGYLAAQHAAGAQ